MTLQMIISMILYFAFLTGVSLILRKAVIRFLLDHGVTSLNYRKIRIPSATGVLIWLVSAFGLLLLTGWGIVFLSEWRTALPAWMNGEGIDEALRIKEHYQTYFTALTIVFWLGWTDDVLGDGTIKGLRGHLAAWITSRTVSTGLLKATGTLLVSLWLTMEAGLWRGGQGVFFGLLSWLVISLYTNTLNLFDLRPGRALKVFLIGSLFTFAFTAKAWDAWMLLIPTLSSALVLLPLDLKGKGMLGDTGANLLGFALGSAVAFTWEWPFQLGTLLLLLVVQVFAERYSITKLIDRIPILKWFDQLGRS